jgi:hypothetical protein
MEEKYAYHIHSQRVLFYRNPRNILCILSGIFLRAIMIEIHIYILSRQKTLSRDSCYHAYFDKCLFYKSYFLKVYGIISSMIK